MKKGLIIFTRIPIPGYTKTRLEKKLSQLECARLHTCFLNDLELMTSRIEGDSLIVFTNSGAESYIGPGVLKDIFKYADVFIEQRGQDLWQRMKNAFSDSFDLGYDSLVLIGSDIPEICSVHINSSLKALDDSDIVITPTEDDGYCLIGMNNLDNEVFDMGEYEGQTVVERTIELAKKTTDKIKINDPLVDIDEEEDIINIVNKFDRHTYPNTYEYLVSLGY